MKVMITLKLFYLGIRSLNMSKNKNTSPLFDLYWENTNLNDKNILSFVNGFINEEKDLGNIEYSTNDIKLDYPRDRLYSIMKKRKSNREYTNYHLTKNNCLHYFHVFLKLIIIAYYLLLEVNILLKYMHYVSMLKISKIKLFIIII